MSSILFKKVNIVDSKSSYNNTLQDVLVTNGVISKIQSEITDSADTVIPANNYVLTTGFIDIFTHTNDPGLEAKESFETAAAAAVAGGYTTIFTLPNNKPVTDTKSQVLYTIQKSQNNIVTALPLGAVTTQTEGKNLAEMYDMHQTGAIAFSDGTKPVQSSGLLLKALQYVKAFDGTIVQMPIDKSIAAHGLMNEGIASVQMGMQGIPHIAEEIIVKRDIDLLRYTQSKLHITGISSKQSIEYIKAAKAEGLQITCSVTPYHLCFCDEDLMNYDTNLKVNPVLRTREDMLALRQAVIDGVIDCIASHHLPHEWDVKACEFEYAAFGISGLQTAFAAVCNAIPSLSNQTIAQLFSSNAAHIFNVANSSIEVGNTANITVFNPTGTTLLTKENNKSYSSNTPFLHQSLKGAIVAVLNKNQMYLAQ